MSIYAVGDLQGCYDPLVRLLDKVKFDPSIDRLYCVGDLVNRGPKSLKVMRFLASMGENVSTVLGNHDFHLMAMAYGLRSPRSSDTLTKLLNSDDLGDHIDWLRKQPLMIRDRKRKVILCHAGIYPWWKKKEAERHSAEISAALSDDTRTLRLLRKIYGNTPGKWSKDLGRTRRQRFIINAFTRMRFCSPKGHLNLQESGYEGRRRKNRLPWFEINNPSLSNYRVVFGHWSALGFLNTANHLCLDTGCVWGRHMTMVKLPEKDLSAPIQKDNIWICPNF